MAASIGGNGVVVKLLVRAMGTSVLTLMGTLFIFLAGVRIHEFRFPLILLSVVLFSGVVFFCDFIFCMINREPLFEKKKLRLSLNTTCIFSLFCCWFFAFVRFLFQPYRVPTGSLEPTVLPGDFILVNQYHYGVRFPIWD